MRKKNERLYAYPVFDLPAKGMSKWSRSHGAVRGIVCLPNLHRQGRGVGVSERRKVGRRVPTRPVRIGKGSERQIVSTQAAKGAVRCGQEEGHVMSERKFLFPWLCRQTGGFFFAEGWDVVKVCPICGPLEEDEGDAFESGHCYRKLAESFFADERSKP
jgi:hypothetical protein